MNLRKRGDQLFDFILPTDEDFMILGTMGGNIEFRDGFTGELIKTYHTPYYEAVRPVPGFDFFILFCSIFILVLWLYYKKKL